MPQNIIDFWFAEDVRERWFDSTPEFDRQLRVRYLDTCSTSSR